MSAIFFIDLINDCCKKNLTSSQLSTIPYYKVSKAASIAKEMRDIDKGILFNFILGHKNASGILRSFRKNKLLIDIFRDLDDLSIVPQRKRRAKDVFSHTLNVLNNVPIDDYALRWAALLHDIGKYNTWLLHKNFKHHEIYSYKRAITILDRFRVLESLKILRVVKHHMYPLEYQRNPIWKEESIIKFIDVCGPEYVLSVIQFSIYDKLAEQNEKTVEPLISLMEKVKKLLNERYEAFDRSQVSQAS